MQAPSPKTAYALMFSVVVVWGANWPIMKIGVQHLEPIWFAAGRVLLGAACLFALCAVTKGIRRPDRRDLPIIFSVGLLQVAAYVALIHVAIQFVDAGRSAILAYTTPLWVVPLAILSLREAAGAAKLSGVALGLAGIGTMFAVSQDGGFDRSWWVGNGLLLLAALAWAVVIVHIRGHRWQGTALDLMPWQMLLGGAILTTAALAIEGLPDSGDPGTLTWVLLYNGPLASAFAFWAFVSANRGLPAISTSLSSLGVPVFGVLASAAALGEIPALWEVVGLGLILTGVAVVAWSDFRHKVKSG